MHDATRSASSSGRGCRLFGSTVERQTFAKQDNTSTTEFEYFTKQVTCTTCTKSIQINSQQVHKFNHTQRIVCSTARLVYIRYFR